MGRKIRKSYKNLQALLHRLGLLPADNEFNRRAREYALHAAALANGARHHKSKKEKQCSLP